MDSRLNIGADEYGVYDNVSRLSYDTYDVIMNDLHNNGINIKYPISLSDAVNSLTRLIRDLSLKHEVSVAITKILRLIIQTTTEEMDDSNTKIVYGYARDPMAEFTLRVILRHNRRTYDLWDSNYFFK